MEGKGLAEKSEESRRRESRRGEIAEQIESVGNICLHSNFWVKKDGELCKSGGEGSQDELVPA